MFFKVFGAGLAAAGLLVSVLFWVPRLVDRQALRRLLGRRYPLIYVIYVANGPGLVALGALLFLRGL